MSHSHLPIGPVPGQESRPGIETSRFDTHAFPRGEQFLAWRARVGHVVDAPPSDAQLADGFHGRIDRYKIGGMVFTDCSTDAMRLERPMTRIATDTNRDYVFHLFVEGEIGHVTGMRRKPRASDPVRGMAAFDLNQPFRIERAACRVLSLFVPRATLDAALPDAESIHGRIVPQHTPLGRLVVDHVAATAVEIPQLDTAQATGALQAATQLLIAAFRQASSVTGADRATLQTALMGQVRRYIDANLHRGDLTPTHVVDALQLKRATIYRWFEHEGGLGTYIRNRRLRAAADELVRYPRIQVVEIAYGLGFKSPSDFTRAFRRAFGMSPQDMRAQALERLRTQP